ncbi:MAG: hypothetical protein J6J36_05545 [Clostridia bacterium]|nr:hypothetical protein [Clostridia bacterium]
MFIYNISINKKKNSKTIFLTISILLIVTLIIFICNIVNSNRMYVQDTMSIPDTIEIPASNYTNVLDDCYANLDNYVGQKIKFSGFIYRLYDFKENQFVLGREMILEKQSDAQAKVVVVGFMCETKTSLSFIDNTWVEIEGTITKGHYHSDIPMIKISSIKEVNRPENEYVYPPDGGYTPTEYSF